MIRSDPSCTTETLANHTCSTLSFVMHAQPTTGGSLLAVAAAASHHLAHSRFAGTPSPSCTPAAAQNPTIVHHQQHYHYCSLTWQTQCFRRPLHPILLHSVSCLVSVTSTHDPQQNNPVQFPWHYALRETDECMDTGVSWWVMSSRSSWAGQSR